MCMGQVLSHLSAHYLYYQGMSQPTYRHMHAATRQLLSNY